MGLVDFLQFIVKYSVDVLAWPLLALAYPLCASIRAIETNSVLDTQKLNTYWVVFSLISLLEHVFCLSDWFPFWPYLRLIIICSLVIPYFDGAFYVYKQVTSSLLSIDAQIIVNWLTKPKETSVDSEKILADVKKYVRENGTEALEKIIADKSGSTKNLDAKEIKAVSSKDNEVVNQANSNSPNVARTDIKPVEVIEKNEVKAPMQANSNDSHVARKIIKAEEVIEKTEVKAAMQVSRVEPEATQTKNITALPTETREKVPEVQAGKILRQTPVSKVAEVEPEVTWTKYITDLPTETREKVSEVQARRVLPVTPVSKVSKVEPEVTRTTNVTALPPGTRGIISEVQFGSVLPQTPVPKKVQYNWICGICEVTVKSETDYLSHLGGKKHKSAMDEAEKTKKLWCKVCKIKCTGKVNMEAHLQGKRHMH